MHRVLCLLIGLTFSGQYLSAAVITDGSIYINDRRFDLSGDGFHVTGGYYFMYNWSNPVGTPTLFRVGAYGTDLAGGPGIGSATVGGVHYPVAYWAQPSAIAGFFVAETASVIIPPGPPMIPHTITAPFTFTGALCGSTEPNYGVPRPCEIDLPSLTGSGIATITGVYVDFGDRMSFDVIMATMDFTEVPEPAAGALAALGIALMLAVRRRRSA